jgi:hypothetical protein
VYALGVTAGSHCEATHHAAVTRNATRAKLRTRLLIEGKEALAAPGALPGVDGVRWAAGMVGSRYWRVRVGSSAHLPVIFFQNVSLAPVITWLLGLKIPAAPGGAVTATSVCEEAPTRAP